MLATDLLQRDAFLQNALLDRDSRVEAFTMAAVRCGVPQIGEGSQRLTFPRLFLAGDALRAGAWARFATEDELAQDPTWHRPLAFVPRSLVHANGQVASLEDPLGLVGLRVTALAQERVQETVVEKEKPDLSGIVTPPTPKRY